MHFRAFLVELQVFDNILMSDYEKKRSQNTSNLQCKTPKQSFYDVLEFFDEIPVGLQFFDILKNILKTTPKSNPSVQPDLLVIGSSDIIYLTSFPFDPRERPLLAHPPS